MMSQALCKASTSHTVCQIGECKQLLCSDNMPTCVSLSVGPRGCQTLVARIVLLTSTVIDVGKSRPVDSTAEASVTVLTMPPSLAVLASMCCLACTCTGSVSLLLAKSDTSQLR